MWVLRQSHQEWEVHRRNEHAHALRHCMRCCTCQQQPVLGISGSCRGRALQRQRYRSLGDIPGVCSETNQCLHGRPLVGGCFLLLSPAVVLLVISLLEKGFEKGRNQHLVSRIPLDLRVFSYAMLSITAVYGDALPCPAYSAVPSLALRQTVPCLTPNITLPYRLLLISKCTWKLSTRASMELVSSLCRNRSAWRL